MLSVHQFFFLVLKQIQKLEEKDKDLAKQDLLYKEQITKLEEKVRNNTAPALKTALFSDQ